MVCPPYQSALRLCVIAAERWAEVEAEYYQINLLRQKPHRFANLVYAWAVSRIDPEKLDEFHEELVDLLPWQDVESEAAEQLESNSFFDMQAKGR